MKKIFTALAIITVVLIGACKKDEFLSSLGLCPKVVTTNPVNGSVQVPLNQVVSVTFNVPMNPATINGVSFVVSGSAAITGTITYSGVTAYFKPSVQLLPNTTYTVRLTTGVRDKSGSALQNDYTWSFSTGTMVWPTVIATDPVNNVSGVVLNKVVTAEFNMGMDAATINTTTFTLKNGSVDLPGTVSYSGSTAVFAPSANLLPNTLYTATISTAVKSTAGIPLANNYVWTFRTGVLYAPIIISTDPVNNATGVLLNKAVAATFNMPMNAATLNPSTFIVKQGTTIVNGAVTYSGSTALFTPLVDLTANEVYTATITTGAKNVAGTAIANKYVWSFTTVAVTAPLVIFTDPVNGEAGVLLNKRITATFNMPMDPLTINALTFLLKQGITPVAGVVSYSGNTAAFKPSVNLLPGLIYTATITTGSKNATGTTLTGNYVWTFSTNIPTTGPLVNLGSAANFGIIAGVGISSNAGRSEIHDMNVGISPGVRSSITGFPPAVIINGFMYASDDITPLGTAAMLTQAKLDLTNAYLFAEGASSPAPVTVAGDQGGKTLAPGIYTSTSTLLIQSGNLTLDAQGDANAVWIFQIASGFTTIGGAGGSVILSGGAQAKNIFWQTGSSATIGDFTSFKGNILALTSITMNSGATATGRMLARNGAVFLTNTNIINKP